jgi:hypothetical protein
MDSKTKCCPIKSRPHTNGYKSAAADPIRRCVALMGQYCGKLDEFKKEMGGFRS